MTKYIRFECIWSDEWEKGKSFDGVRMDYKWDMKIKTYNNPSIVGSLVQPNTENWSSLLLLLLFKN